jgi:SIR2-like domain
VAKGKKVRESKNSIRLVCRDCAGEIHRGVAAMPQKRNSNRKPQETEKVARALVSRLYEDILHEACVVFIGSGCTTEGKGWGHSDTFYDEIRAKSGFPSKALPPSFPDLMEYFCKQMDGGQHNRLIREAVSRIERFAVPGEDNYVATRFGEELAQIPYFNRFVTTNWDPFLERSLEILIPMVADRDLAFWDDMKRQVLKIHGCITRPYSIVATKTDYEKCLKRNPLIFNKLREQMATKTFVFVGYSLRDSDFRQVWEGITKSLGRFAKLAYAVDPNASTEDVNYWKERGIEIFNTFEGSTRNILSHPNSSLSFWIVREAGSQTFMFV